MNLETRGVHIASDWLECPEVLVDMAERAEGLNTERVPKDLAWSLETLITVNRKFQTTLPFLAHLARFL